MTGEKSVFTAHDKMTTAIYQTVNLFLVFCLQCNNILLEYQDIIEKA
jgi:hypothetical protein